MDFNEEPPPWKDCIAISQEIDNINTISAKQNKITAEYDQERLGSNEGPLLVKEGTASGQQMDDSILAVQSKDSTPDCVEPCAVSDLCRLCCTSNSVENDIFEPEDDLQSKMLHMRIEVRRGDGLPRRVCGACRCSVLRLHRFCSEANRAQRRLRAMLQGTDEAEDIPTTNQERGTQTECQPDSYLDLDSSGPYANAGLHGSDSTRPNIHLINVKQEFLESDDGAEQWDGESDDNKPLVDIKVEKSTRKRQANLSCLQELRKKRPDLEIKVKVEQQESWPSEFPYPEVIMYEEGANNDPEGTSAAPKRKRGRPRKNQIAAESVTVKRKVKFTRPKENRSKNKRTDEPDKVMKAKSTKPNEDSTNNEEAPVNGELVPKVEDDSDDDGLGDWEFPKKPTKLLQVKNKELYTCCICSKTLESREKCLEHYKDHEEEPEPERGSPPPAPAPPAAERCPRCGAALAAEPWPQHWRRHWLRDRYRCALCVHALHFQKMREIVRHGISQHAREKDAHGTVKYMCDLCPTKFVQMKTLLHHRMVKHPDAGGPRPRCARCSFVGKNPPALRHHVNRKHDFNPYLCPHCGKTFNQPHHLKRHVALHSGEKPHKCRFCGKGFATAAYLPDHERTHTGEKPHKCAYCGRGFSQRSSRTTHERSVHSQERPFSCQLCGRSFATKGLLTSHLKTACV